MILTSLLSCARTVIFPLKWKKLNITIYWIEVDSNAIICRLPEQKLVKIRLKLQEVKQRKKVTLKVLQFLIGLRNYACLVVVPGRAFFPAHIRFDMRGI